MLTSPTPMRSVLRLAFLLPLLAAVALPASAQGRLTGTVTDADTGETLPGVNVLILGTSLGAATNFDGRYTIEGIRAGEYTVQASYIGYETKQFTGIEVEVGGETELNIELGEAVLQTEGEIVVIGERPLVDVEQSSSAYTVGREEIAAAPVREIQDVVATQAGVVQDPTGLYIRGGRADETGFIVDGVSAKDPLSGTGFGLDLGANAFAEVEVTTGGVGADVGDATSGVVSVTTRDGTDEFHGSFSTKRDNFGVNDTWGSTWNESVYEGTLSGPILPGSLRFFATGQARFSDEFTRFTSTPDQVQSSLVDGEFFMPRTDNRWSGLGKLTYIPKPGMKLQGSYQRSLTVNQNTRMLQVTGNDDVIRPGYQYAFALQPDNANTYSHDNNLAYLKWTQVLNDISYYEVQVSRLFTRLRADANGRDWRPEDVSEELDPASIVDYPAELFVDENGQPVDPNTLFVLPGPGLFNNGGVATRWHDHFAEEMVLKGSYTRFTANRGYELTAGFDVKLNDYQWIDIIRPWIGAPVVTADGDTTSTNRLGEASDVWRVKPRRAAFFVQNQFRYKGLIANVGLRSEFWAPGEYVDELVADSVFTIPEAIREGYLDESVSLFGLRWKARLLPKVRVSFPVRENQVLFFNYGHSTRLPHPTFLYTNLDPFFQDRSFFGDLGNPNLNPEVDISYELGVRNQLTSNDALTLTAFWRDKFDFITVASVTVEDATGRETNRALRVNGDFARVRGLEVSYIKRIADWFRGQINASYSRATGLASTNSEALNDLIQDGNIDNTFETPLAWDRPLDIKASTTFTYDRPAPLWGVPGLNRFRLYLSSTFRSGQRYTPVEFIGREVNPFTGERDWRPIYETVDDPEQRFSEVGAPWWWFDLNLQRRVALAGQDVVFSLEVTNLFNQQNAVLVNPVTGEGYPDVDADTDFTDLRGNDDYDVPSNLRDPRYEDPNTSGLPPLNPARFLPPRHVMLGVSFEF
jgi:outer membrane receptor protein involved in Fe transport